MRARTTRLLPFLVLGFLATGCDPEGEFGAEDLDEEACVELQTGQAMPINAATQASSAPSVTRDDRHDINIADTGFVTYISTGGLTVFFLDTSVPFSVQATNGSQSLFLETNTVTPACTDVVDRHEVDLPGGTYNLEFGPTVESQVRLVIKSDEQF